jgi:YebC/PmpR family DNA-binding regulatory protein
MSGHSKWSTIKRKKALVDSKRSKIWTKIIKEISVAARTGGGDPTGNPRLRMALDKARAANMTKDAIKRAIDKATGEAGGAAYEDVIYEGYGPGGVAIVVECMTDNRNRTVGEIRYAFDRFGGNLGTSGSVGWMFAKRGILHVEKSAAGEDQLMELALEAGAEDVRDEGEVFAIETPPSSFLAVRDALAAAGIEPASAEIDNIPQNRIPLEGDTAVSMLKMVSALEELDDVQNVYTNSDIAEEILERHQG